MHQESKVTEMVEIGNGNRNRSVKTPPDNGDEDSETGIVSKERAASTDSFTGSWQSKPKVLPSTAEEGGGEIKEAGNTDASTMGDEQIRSLSSFGSSQGSECPQATGARRNGAGKTKAQQQAARFREEEKRINHFAVVPSQVDQEKETKGTDEGPSMVLRDDDAFHTNPDSTLGNVLRMLKKNSSVAVDEEQRSATAQRSPLHRTSSGRCSSMYGEEDSD